MECCPGMRSEHVTRTSFTMFPKVRVPSQSVHLWVMLLCTPVLTRTSEPVSEDLQNFTAATAPGNWTGATMQLQPEGLTTAKVQTETPTSNYTGVSCVALLPPRGGSFYVESGTGMSVGSSLVFWCREGFQLLGSHKIHCLVRNGNARWSDYLPECQAIPRLEDRGLRVAVLASVVSAIVILAMSLSFLVCCLQERCSNTKDVVSRRREKSSARHKQPSSINQSWLEREEDEWENFPPPNIFPLSQRMAADSALYLPGGLGGLDNRGYHRSQESLLKAPPPGVYRSESQLYPHVVLQRGLPPTAPSAPLYLHLPTPAHPQPHSMGGYPVPMYPPYPNTCVPAFHHHQQQHVPAPTYPDTAPTPLQPWH
ncbi:sushi domain-containing protein 3 isoform X2 [Entelurus aequoreus]|uniref:sushi domain-containing protein 3 isoform X2 n=1 Tax=Entelurus aequoreus TaxID=161455 RepID=UPI002B1D2AA8|nr:sushi domain-containing protein 3 isoform X2 [Entelurus aequoreus]